ncbi:sugar phosphate isomerase/epimerase family protein [Paenibacillus cisolokensis]|uniref:sugar phosphate isomerase/epimerase family protein n=1 Tax=Paenibacillus cisolokensis TaxID=1658519 RepID=UPI003D2B3FD3
MLPFRTSLNASTLFPFKLELKEQIRVAAEAGYEGIEIWMRDLEAYAAAGHTLASLKRYIADTGIGVVNAIAFFKWADEDPAVREQSFGQAKREMEMLAEIGCGAVAAPPFGQVENVPLEEMAVQYARLIELGRPLGVEPYLEFWGRARKLSKLSEAVYVAMESGYPDAKLLLDPFHMYVGGSRLETLSYLNGSRIGIVHVNDYPASPGREHIADRDRLFPGDGIAPSATFARLLYEIGYDGFLSLELFTEDFGGESALDVASRGLMKMRAAYAISGQTANNS